MVKKDFLYIIFCVVCICGSGWTGYRFGKGEAKPIQNYIDSTAIDRIEQFSRDYIRAERIRIDTERAELIADRSRLTDERKFLFANGKGLTDITGLAEDSIRIIEQIQTGK